MSYFASAPFYLPVTGLLVTGGNGDFATVTLPYSGRHTLLRADVELLSTTGGITGTIGVQLDFRTNTGGLGFSYGGIFSFTNTTGQNTVTIISTTAAAVTGVFAQSGITIRQINPTTSGILGVKLVVTPIP